MANLKVWFYHICRACGLFALARVATRRQLRILCYHSFELTDESRFRGKMFLRGDTLRRRLQRLRSMRYPVVTLSDGLDALFAGKLRDGAVVITIDDGFTGVARIAAPIFAEFNLRPTLYVTTARLQSGVAEYHLIVQYMFWKSVREEIAFAAPWWSTGGTLALADQPARKRIGKACARALLANGDDRERHERCAAIAAALGIDLNSILQIGSFNLMSPESVRALSEQGFDIELHTHNHRLPADDVQAARQEVEVNREQLHKITGKSLTHFCYPSGDWTERHWPILESVGVHSATTCDPGLNDARTPRFALRRFLDADSISDIEFEAELSGFQEWVRKLRSFGGRRPLNAVQSASDAI